MAVNIKGRSLLSLEGARTFSAYPVGSATGVRNPYIARHEHGPRESPLQAGSPWVSSSGGPNRIGRGHSSCLLAQRPSLGVMLNP